MNAAEADLPAASTCQSRVFVAVTFMSWKVTATLASIVPVVHASSQGRNRGGGVPQSEATGARVDCLYPLLARTTAAPVP
jgi:hypothetical protein